MHVKQIYEATYEISEKVEPATQFHVRLGVLLHLSRAKVSLA